METSTTQTKKLLKKFLPPHKVTYCEVEDQEILGLSFKSAGIAVELKDGPEVFGSSSAQENDPLIYAAYECLERFVILNQPKNEDPYEGSQFKWSLSNGVAFHHSYQSACENAYAELLERNEVLKSWFYNTPIKHLEVDTGFLGPGMLALYDIVVVDLSTIPMRNVIGFFALPKKKGVNLIYGFGSSKTLNGSIAKAKKEFVTRLGFLWGESSCSGPVPVGPQFHQEFYLENGNLKYIREWLFGEKYPKKETNLYQLSDVTYINMTPQDWNGGFLVVKASSEDAISLFFGLPHDQVFDFPYRCDIPHPIA